MATVKKPLQTTIKVDTNLWKVISGIQERCGKEVIGKNGKPTTRKAQAGTVIDGLLSALVEAADEKTIQDVIAACAIQDVKDDRRGEFVGQIIPSRDSATVAGIPDDADAQRKMLEGLLLKNPELVKSMAGKK
ncbi:hypothetical protein OAA10_00390 [bacterium]|nr:hypothetical protein [bacterium]